MPDSAIEGMRNHLERYYAKMREQWDDFDEPAPWNEPEEDSYSEKSVSTAYLRAVYSRAKEMLPDWMWNSLHQSATAQAGGTAQADRGRLMSLLGSFVPSHGQGKIAFVGASPSDMDLDARKPLSGAAGEEFEKRYLSPLGLTRDDVFISNVVPVVLYDDDGNVRSPTRKERRLWKTFLERELMRVEPTLVIALGRIAKEALGERAEYVLPHPNALLKFGDSGELDRKLAALRMTIESLGVIKKVQDSEKNTQSVEKSWSVSLIKQEDKRLVYGIVLEPETVDAQGDIVSAAEIEESAHGFMLESQVIGRDHEQTAPARIVESYIAPADLTIGGQSVRKGSWVMGVKVQDDAFWEQVKNGEYTGFSIGAYANRRKEA